MESTVTKSSSSSSSTAVTRSTTTTRKRERNNSKQEEEEEEINDEEIKKLDSEELIVPKYAAISMEEMKTGSNKNHGNIHKNVQTLKDASGEFRRVLVPPHRYTPLRENWDSLVTPLTTNMKLNVRFNPKFRSVELKTSKLTDDAGALQKGCDFVQAFCFGFEVQDAIALLRLDDLFIDSFEIHDVKNLRGDHLGRAIGRIAGQGGKTKFAIENATRTRIVLAEERIFILGSFNNIKVARDAICRLILGAPPGKVYNSLKTHASRMNDR